MDEILAHLENIDDDLDEKEGENNFNFYKNIINSNIILFRWNDFISVLFIKTSSIKALPEYGVEQVPSVYLFRKGIPAPCPVSLLEESEGKVAI